MKFITPILAAAAIILATSTTMVAAGPVAVQQAPVHSMTPRFNGNGLEIGNQAVSRAQHEHDEHGATSAHVKQGQADDDGGSGNGGVDTSSVTCK